jgi:two-component system, sensor histidine kinase RegB
MIFPSFFRVLPQHEALRTLFLMRLVALVGQVLVIALAEFWLGISLPLQPLLAAMMLLAAFNIWTWKRLQRPQPASDAELFIQLLIDVATLSVLLYFSGGATNPFVSFYLPALAVAAAILPWLPACVLALASIVCYSLLTSNYIPLEVRDSARAVTYHLAGMWANFAVSAGLITWFVARMSTALRERDRQLAAAREQHLQSERLVALGAQAASAAHQMGTPLSTVALLAGELLHEAGQDAALAAYRDDLTTIEAQIALCKAVLDQMGKKAKEGVSALDASVEAGDWLAGFAGEWRLRHPEVRLQLSASGGPARIRDVAVLAQILQILLDNAVQATAGAGTAAPVALSLVAEPQAVVLRVTDGGRGIAPDLLKRLGYEPVSSTSGGQGIGLLLAFASARQIGATLVLSACQPAGTTATLTLAPA